MEVKLLFLVCSGYIVVVNGLEQIYKSLERKQEDVRQTDDNDKQISKRGDNPDPHRLRANKEKLRLRRQIHYPYCKAFGNVTVCDPNYPYRSADGTCNNLQQPTWGVVLCPQTMEFSTRDNDRLGVPLPSARVISNVLHVFNVNERSRRNDKLTMMAKQWGQFTDDDIVIIPVPKDEEGAYIECCYEVNESRTQCFQIRIPDDGSYFNKTCIEFVGSTAKTNQTVISDVRERWKELTTFIDGSMVYGSTPENTNALRTTEGAILAGDSRASDAPSLTSNQKSFMREHNRIVRNLANINRHWDDEVLFQQTRRIISAILQIITYKEYLPAILNEDTLMKYELNLNTTGYACEKFYNSKLNPTVFNTLAVFRLFEADSKNEHDIDLDLLVLNIQRGRDHGLPAYNHWRNYCGLEKGNMTEDGEFILVDHSETETHILQHVYRHPDDIDLFAGAITETLLPNSLVGPTFSCLIGDQFRKLKKGDRFWHETPDKLIRFTKDQLAELRKVTLAKVICDNSEIGKIQPKVFRVPGPGNEIMDCIQLPAINLDKWKSCKKLLPGGMPNFKKRCANERNN